MGLELEWELITKTLVFLINAIGIVLIFLVYFSNPKSRLNQIFVATTFLMFIWVDFAFLARLEGQAERSLLWIRIAWSITPLLFSLIYFLVIHFIGLQKKYRFLDIFNIFLGVLFIILGLFTDFVIKNIKFDGITLNIIYGQLVFLFFGAVFYLTILNFALLFKKYFESSVKEERIKILYLLIGLFFFFLMNSIFNIALPVFLRIVHLYEFGDYSTIILLCLIAYTIVKKELFGIKIIIPAVLISLITILLGLDILVFTPDLLFKLYKGLVLVIFLYFGYLLIRSVLREIESRERIKKAYDMEKKAREQIEELTEAKTQFIMATQHHLRTPLTSMIGYLDLIFGGTYGKVPVKIKQALLKFQSSTKRLIRVVDELLDISQFQLGKEVVSLEPGTDLSPILKEVIEELQFEVEYRDLYLKLEKIGKVPKIRADSEKLKVALFNIVDNAIKYTRKGGITIILQKAGPNVQISVKDTGIGLDSEKAKVLFESAFVRGKEAKKVHGFGRGIGVYVTGHIIKAHHGKIWAESEGEGKGSTFFIELPI